MEPASRCKGSMLLTIIMTVLVCSWQAGAEESISLEAPSKWAKDIISLGEIDGQGVSGGPLNFAEVEIVASERLSVEDISALARAPGSDFEVLSEPSRVRVQLAAGLVQALEDAGVEFTVVREFLLFEGFAVDGEMAEVEPQSNPGCSADYLYGASGADVGIPLGAWAGSAIGMGGAPSGSEVTCVDVHYEIENFPWSWLYVDLTDSDYDFNFRLYGSFYTDDGYISGTSHGISTFNGRQPNQTWVLWAANGGPESGGYITYWWIKVYHWIPAHCDASSVTCREYISGVEVGDISNTGTGCSQYADYTSQSATMELELGYPITVTNGNPQAGDECGIWVDWNEDWDFEDPCESTVVSGSPGLGPYTATITPPADTIPGDKRMRIRICSGGTLNPCDDAAYGEVEDYTITVIPALAYCYATTVYCGWEYISNVEVGDISNPTDCSKYAYYPSMSTAMEVGTDYPITVTNGYPDASDECGIWVDWNRDGDFDDASETISVSGSPGVGPYTGTITPPAAPEVGGCRLRVRICYGTPNPCGTCEYGDVEDYTISVTGGPTTFTIAGNVSSGAEPIKDLEGVTMSGLPGDPVTDVNGDYTATVDAGWSGTVTPTKTQWSIPGRTYTNVQANAIIEDYTGTATECYNSSAPDYVWWAANGMPDCWCYRKQCHGDANGEAFLGKWVTVADNDLLKAAFGLVVLPPNGACADFNHEAFLGKRVTVADNDILKLYFGSMSVPECDENHVNVWTN